MLWAAAVLIVHVGEAGAGVPRALVTVAQERLQQKLRTDDSGTARFRCEEGDAKVSVDPRMPPGWALEGATSQTIHATFSAPVVLTFKAKARRILRGVVYADVEGKPPLPGFALSAGGVSGASDAQGRFELSGVPAGKVVLRSDDVLNGSVDVQVPGPPGETGEDLALPVERLPAGDLLRLRMGTVRVVPQPPASRPVADWLSGKGMSEAEIDGIERLSAVTNLDPAFRLLVVGAPDKPGPEGVVRAVQAATGLFRYLTGPGLVARERIAFLLGPGAGNLARPGHLTLVLARSEEGGR